MTSGTCISTTRDPATKRIQNSLFVRRVVPCIQKSHNIFHFVFYYSYLLPERKGKWKQKTPVVRRTLNPTFNHKFSYEEVSSDDLKERVLEISIYDFDRASPDEFIGGVRLGLGTSDNEWDDATEDECQIWQTMLSRSNVWIQVVVPLRSTMVSKKSV